MGKNQTQRLRVLAILPAYNEETTIKMVIKDVLKKNPGINICVVDDGSYDSTAVIAKDMSVDVISHPFNMGIGVAVQTGFMYAVRKQYDIAIQVDADGQHDPGYIGDMISFLQKDAADVISGSRFINKEGYKSSFWRRMGITFFKFMNWIILGQRITDSTSGFRAYNRGAIEFLSHNYPEDYPEPEALVILKKAGFRIKEIPVVMRERQGGKSSIHGFRSFHYMAKVILAILMQSVKGEKN